MSDREREQQALEAAAREQSDAAGDEAIDEDASSPFDHPAFLPVLLWGMAVWFGYDGWFNENIKAVMFNRYGFGLLVVLALYFTIQSLRETRARDEKSPEA